MYKTKLYPNEGSPPIIVARKTTAAEALYAHREALKRDDVEENEQVLTVNPKGIIYAYGSDISRLRKVSRLPFWM